MRDKLKKIFSNVAKCRKCPLYSGGFCHIDDKKATCDTYSGIIIELPNIMHIDIESIVRFDNSDERNDDGREDML